MMKYIQNKLIISMILHDFKHKKKAMFDDNSFIYDNN